MSDTIPNLVREMHSWTSIHSKTENETTVFDNDAGSKPARSLKTEYDYIECSDQKRMVDSEYFANGKLFGRLTGYCDGKRCAAIVFRATNGVSKQENVRITRSFLSEQEDGLTSRPYPFAFQYVGLIPLYEALPKAERLGPGTVLGRPCDVYLFRGVKGIIAAYEEVYYLDSQTSVPLKVEWYTSQEFLQKQVPIFWWEAKTLDVVDGYHVPLSSKSVVYKKKSLPRLEEDTTVITTVKKLEYNKNFKTDRFWPEFEPGVLVLDALQKKSYVVPGGAGQTRQAVSADEFGVGGPPDPWAWLTPVALGLGLTLLLAALVLKFRGRKASR